MKFAGYGKNIRKFMCTKFGSCYGTIDQDISQSLGVYFIVDTVDFGDFCATRVNMCLFACMSLSLSVCLDGTMSCLLFSVYASTLYTCMFWYACAMCYRLHVCLRVKLRMASLCKRMISCGTVH